MSNSEIIEWLKKKAETVTMPGARKMYEAAAKALEAQKYMISRQAVLDALNNIEIPRNASWYQYYQQALTAVEKLPPAPTTEVATDNNVGTKVSTNLAEVGTDCISRQTAIDAIDDIESEVVDGFGFQYEKWRKHFAELPSAQPEIIYCKDCGHRDDHGCCKYWKGLSMGEIPIATDDYDFCNHAKRREVTT